MRASTVAGAGRIARPIVVIATLALVASTALAAASPVVAASRDTAGHATVGGAVREAAPCVRGSSACPIRITFRRGAYAGSGRAVLTGQGMERWFVVRARAGQTMVVVLDGKGATGGEVHFPGGGQDGGPGGRIYDGTLPATGDYRIRVTESLMAEPWKGPVTVIVFIY